jgi:hypothetical protein
MRIKQSENNVYQLDNPNDDDLIRNCVYAKFIESMV